MNALKFIFNLQFFFCKLTIGVLCFLLHLYILLSVLYWISLYDNSPKQMYTMIGNPGEPGELIYNGADVRLESWGQSYELIGNVLYTYGDTGFIKVNLTTSDIQV